MSYRDSRRRLQRITESPSHLTICGRVQELVRDGGEEFGYRSFISADGTELHANIITGVNERYEEMKENHDTKATVMGDADKDPGGKKGRST